MRLAPSIPSASRPAALAAPARSLTVERVEAGFCWLAIGLGVFLRLFRFWEPSLWLDETVTAHVAAAKDWATLLQRCSFEYHPPVHYLVAKFFLLFGRHEFFLRLPSLLFGAGAIAALMFTVRRFLNARGALYAGAIFALQSRAILHSQDARMYAMALLLAVVSIYLFVRILEGARWELLAGYAAVHVLLGYNHVLYTCVLAGQIAVALGFLALSAERPAALRRLLTTQAAVLLLLAPLVRLVWAMGASRGALYGWIERPGLEWLKDFVTWPEVSFGVVLLPGLLALWWRRGQMGCRTAAETALLSHGLAYLAIWPAAVILARLEIVNIVQARYLLVALVGLLIVAAFCVAKVDAPALRIGLCVYLGLTAYMQLLILRNYGPWVGILPNQDWRAANQWIQAHYRPGDVVLVKSGLTPVKTRRPVEPGAQEYLSSPVTGFYSRRPMTVFNLPWHAAELESSLYTPPAVRDQVRRAGHLFVLINPQRDKWEWQKLESWIAPADGTPQLVEARNFRGLQMRAYRLGKDPRR